MIKYLPTAGDALTDTRVKATDKAVVFQYDTASMFKVIMETCQNMVKIAQDEHGNILVDEYSMDETTPSANMKQQLAESTASEIMEHMFRLCTDEQFEKEAAQGGYVLDVKDTNSIQIPIDSLPTYETSMLKYVDDAISKCFIYGILDAWFTAVNSDVLKKMAMVEYESAKATLIRSIKPMFRKLLFNRITK